MRERSKPEAIERLKQNLVLEEIAKQEAIEPTGEEISAKIKEIQEKYPDENYDVTRLQNYLKDDLKKEKTLDFVQSKATIELVPEGTLKTSEQEENEEQTQETQE